VNSERIHKKRQWPVQINFTIWRDMFKHMSKNTNPVSGRIHSAACNTKYSVHCWNVSEMISKTRSSERMTDGQRHRWCAAGSSLDRQLTFLSLSACSRLCGWHTVIVATCNVTANELLHILDWCRSRLAAKQDSRRAGWLVGRLMSPFSTKIGYIGDKVLGGDLVPSG